MPDSFKKELGEVLIAILKNKSDFVILQTRMVSDTNIEQTVSLATNNVQVITLGSQTIGVEVAKKLVDTWLEAEFKGGRSLPKVEKMETIDKKYRAAGK
jgi:hypothetical protein